MRKFSICLTIIILISVNLMAQSDFRPGYIIKNNGDTLSGLIDYKGNQANARKCVFRLSKEASDEKFTPDDIKAYRFIDSKYYVSKKVMTGDSIETQLFLEYLIDGIVDIYYYLSPSGDNYYVDPGDGNLLLVKNIENEIMGEDGVRYVSEQKKYKRILYYVFGKSAKVRKEISNMSLNHKSMIRIARDYHEEVCTDKECVVFEKKLQVFKVNIGPVIGISMDGLEVDKVLKENYYFLEGSDFNMSVFPSAGLRVRFTMPNLNERLSFIYSPELGYQKFRTLNQTDYMGYPAESNISFSRYNLINSAFLCYDFTFGKIKPYVFAGVRIDYYFKTDYSRKLSYTGGAFIKEYNIYPFPISISYSPAIGAGISHAFENAGTFALDFLYYKNLRQNFDIIVENGFAFRLSYLL